MRFTEVVYGHQAEEGIEILRSAESEAGDLLILIKKEDTEEYQISLEMKDGRVGVEEFDNAPAAQELFDQILNREI